MNYWILKTLAENIDDRIRLTDQSVGHKWYSITVSDEEKQIVIGIIKNYSKLLDFYSELKKHRSVVIDDFFCSKLETMFHETMTSYNEFKEKEAGGKTNV